MFDSHSHECHGDAAAHAANPQTKYHLLLNQALVETLYAALAVERIAISLGRREIGKWRENTATHMMMK